MFIWAPVHSEKDDKRGKKSPRITVGELQRKVASLGSPKSRSWGSPKLPLDVISVPTKSFGRHARKKPFLSFRHKCKRLEFAKRYWNIDWNPVLWSDETKMDLFHNQHLRWVWRKKKNADSANNLYVCVAGLARASLLVSTVRCVKAHSRFKRT